ncbi:MAG: alpha/beta hydrolase fold domain-containing protein [Pyrinomonadaceae bacterium]
MSKHPFIITLAILCSMAAAFATVWIVVPAPATLVWLVAVAASEWSLWLGSLGLIGAGLSLLAFAFGSRWMASVALVLGILAGVLALIPLIQAWRVARANGVQLSLPRYVFGSSEAAADIVPQTITYATVAGQTLKLDAWLPKDKATSSRPAVVVVHGGSWSGGERSDFPQWDKWLAAHGYAVFDVDYRLAPQPNWRTATGDVKCAIGWIKSNAAQYGIDPERIALMGRSAGGQLALLAAYAPDDDARLPSSCAVTKTTETSVRAVIAVYAPTDLVWAYDHPANQRVIDGPATLRSFLGGDPQQAAEAYAAASPVARVRSQTPPTLLFHGGQDQLVRDENMTLLAQRLSDARVPHRTIFIPYAQHGFDYNFNGWGSQLAQPVMLGFLETHLAAR